MSAKPTDAMQGLSYKIVNDFNNDLMCYLLLYHLMQTTCNIRHQPITQQAQIPPDLPWCLCVLCDSIWIRADYAYFVGEIYIPYKILVSDFVLRKDFFQ